MMIIKQDNRIIYIVVQTHSKWITRARWRKKETWFSMYDMHVFHRKKLANGVWLSDVRHFGFDINFTFRYC